MFAAQDLFYNIPLSTVTVILSILSIGLFGYGVAGVMRPIAVWHVDAVYWSTLPTVKTLQGLHWQEVKSSKPMRFFWYAYVTMFFYEFFPAYIFPYLNSVSIPCLAAMKATGAKAANLTNLFGGSLTNEGLGLFTLSFDWQYVSLGFYLGLVKLRLTDAMSFRSPHSILLSRSPFRLMRPLATLFALPQCWASTIQMDGEQGHCHSCLRDFGQMKVQITQLPRSSKVVYLTTKLWPNMASLD